MSRRARRILVAVSLIGLAAGSISYLIALLTLRGYQDFIHRAYAPEMEQLAETLRRWPDKSPVDDETYLRIEAARQDLERTFGAGDFYHASWSFDGHHGMRSTGLPDGGFRTWPMVSTTDSLRRSLYFGQSVTGTPLLIYEGGSPRRH
jgi:hypothetical protein